MQQIPQKSLVRDAYEIGQNRASYGLFRASPFYCERVLIGGKRIDITPLLDAFFYAGFDGEPYPDKPQEVKPDALDSPPDPLSTIERLTPEHLAERQDEKRAASESEAGSRQEGISGAGAGEDGA